MPRLPLISLFVAATLPASAAAQVVGVTFQHEDWELACDNTRTCRAAGYQRLYEAEAGEPVSVLLTRKAGPSQPVKAQLKVLDEETEQDISTLRFFIDDRDLGRLSGPGKESDAFSLNKAQTESLLAALTRRSQIYVTGEKGKKWALSDKGAAAVLLKMDEFQGRLNTPGALIRKGRRAETDVLPPLPEPVVRIGAIAAPQSGDARVAKDPALRKSLIVPGDEDCDRLTGNNTDEQEEPASIDVVRLSADKLLVSTLCWRAAYNEGYGYWIINQKQPYQPIRVTSIADGLDSEDFRKTGQLTSAQKGRGLGDCWGGAEWSWDGKQFIQTQDWSTGKCAGFTGGAWHLPGLVSKVVR
jgi:hypothetical protein